MLNNVILTDRLGFRLATANDQIFIEKLFRSTREFVYLADAEAEYVNRFVEQQRQMRLEGYGCRASDACTMIIEKSEVPIGKVVVNFGHNVAHIFDLLLLPEERGNGYTKAVLQAMQHIAEEQAVPVGLSVEKLNRSAKQLYSALGFQLAEDMGTHEFLLWYPPASHAVVGLRAAS